MVINGPEAKAGFTPNRLSKSGVMVPINEANRTTEKSAIATVAASGCSRINKITAPKTISERILTTFPRRTTTNKDNTKDNSKKDEFLHKQTNKISIYNPIALQNPF